MRAETSTASAVGHASGVSAGEQIAAPVITSEPRTKVVHVLLTLNPGGLETFVCNLSGSKELAGTDFLFCCLDEKGPLANVVERAGHKVVVERRGPGFNFRLIFRLAALFKRYGAVAVHTHSLDPMLYAGIAGALAGTPVRLHTQHNTFLKTCSWKDRIKFRVATWFCTNLVAVSDETRRGMVACGASEAKTSTIVNGIDVASFSAPRRRHRDERPLTIGCVARLSPEKGVDRLIRAFAIFAANEPGAQLAIAGDGPQRGELVRLASALGVAGCARFIGYTPNIREFLSQLDIFVLPSLTEGVPMALLEAMAAPLPIIATRVGGVPEVVETRDSALLVPPDNVEQLARAISELAGCGELRSSLALNANTRVRTRFSQANMARAYGFIYSDPPLPLSKRCVRGMLRQFPRRAVVYNRRGSADVAVTFDDGPDPIFTPRILEILRAHGARATFFLIGDRAERHPAIVGRIADEGHEIANHSYSHPDFAGLDVKAASEQVTKTQVVLQHATLFRPPRGRLCVSSMAAAWRKFLTIVMWNVDLKDFRAQRSEEILSALRATRMQGGDIVLYHGNSEASLEALPAVLRAAAASGRRLVTVSELLK